MSSKLPAIRVENLGKCYQVYANPKDRLRQAVMPRLRAFGGLTARQYYREFWALRGVSFEVAEGETVGIIGRNGSGKSTLLQMICGTLDPTEGTVETQGRVAALLELGAGFNPEFTGRENVFMNASVLGLEDEEIADRFDDIAAFADIGEFIEQPVKHYSSGMYARLAFAVAISVDAKILVVDEALSVGDEPFQRKCFVKIEQFKSQGGSILFVSHSSGAIINHCDRAVLLNEGQSIYTGQPKRAVFYSQKIGLATKNDVGELIRDIQSDKFSEDYADYPEIIKLSSSKARCAVHNSLSGSSVDNVDDEEFYDDAFISLTEQSYSENGAKISRVEIRASSGRKVNNLSKGNKYMVDIDIDISNQCRGVKVYVVFKTVEGLPVTGSVYPGLEADGIDLVASSTLNLRLDFVCQLNAGTYFLNVAVQGLSGVMLHRRLDVVVFKVQPRSCETSTGLVDINIVHSANIYLRSE